jgi:PAS domain S-box-containing protein
MGGDRMKEPIFRDNGSTGRSKATLQRESDINEALAELSSALISSKSIEEISDLALESVKRLTGSAIGFVGYIEPETGDLICPTFTRDVWEDCLVEDKNMIAKRFRGLWGWVLNNRKSLIANSPAEDPRSIGTPPGHLSIHRFLSVPAIYNGMLVGQIALANSDREYTEQDLSLVERLAELYAIAINRKHTEDELVLRAQLLDSANDSIVLHDPEGRFHYVNEVACRLFGCTREELLRKNVQDLKIPESAESWQSGINELRTSGRCVFEIVIASQNGSRFPVEVNARVLEIRGKQFVLSVARDITERKQAEEALSDSENRLRSIFNNSSVGIILSDNTGRALMVNKTYCNFLGYSEQELLGRRFQEFTLPEDLPINMQRHEDLIAGKIDSYVFEKRYIRKDGAIMWGRLSISLVRDDLGRNKSRVITICEDISERKRVEQAISASKASLRIIANKYRMLSAYSRDIILYVEHGDGRIIEANEAAVKEYGYSRAELLGMTIYDLRAEDERQLVDEQMRKADEAGVVFEAYHRRKDGSALPVEVISQGTTIKGKRFLLSIIRNITLRRQQEEKLLIANEVFEHALAGIIVISRGGVIQRINPAFTAITGYSEDDVIGQQASTLGYDAALGNSDSYCGETWNKRKDGTPYLEGFIVNTVRDEEGNVLQYIKNCRDITEKEEARRERQLLLEQKENMQRLASLSALSAGIVHEIAQPLNVIKLSADGILYLYNQGIFHLEEFINGLTDISGQAERINTLIKQMRSFANAGRQNETAPCNLNQAVKNMIDILSRRMADHGITAKIEVDEDLPEVVGTVGGYEELVLNLLTNAMYALDSVNKQEKEIVIRTSLQKNKAVLTVADNATGISDDIKYRIFEPLFTTKKSGEGMGIGLSIVQSIVERFGGGIDVENNTVGGATFTIQLPAIQI